jgi:sulfur carrier protein
LLFSRLLSVEVIPKVFLFKQNQGMRITVNHIIQEIEAEQTLASLLANLFPQRNFQGIAIAVNQKIVVKENWPVFQIKENDNIVLIRATQGG